MLIINKTTHKTIFTFLLKYIATISFRYTLE